MWVGWQCFVGFEYLRWVVWVIVNSVGFDILCGIVFWMCSVAVHWCFGSRCLALLGCSLLIWCGLGCLFGNCWVLVVFAVLLWLCCSLWFWVCFVWVCASVVCLLIG